MDTHGTGRSHDRIEAALVTGASRGLGEAVSAALARDGVRVVMVARGAEELHAAAQRIQTAGGIAFDLPGDLGAKEDIHRIAGAAAALAGPIDLLVHNASTLGVLPMPLLLDTPCEDLEQTLEVNLVGPFRLTKVIAGSMALRGRGAVVHITSDAGINGYPRWGAYGVSKAALDQLARVFGAELAASGVRFVSIDPGEMDTQMHRDAIPDADPATLLAPAVVAERVMRVVRALAEIEPGARVEAARYASAEGDAR